MSLAALLGPIIEAITGILAIYITARLNSSSQNLFLISIFGILRRYGFKRFRLSIWYLTYFILIIFGVYFAFTSGPSTVKGPFLLSILDAMTLFIILYGLILLSSRAVFKDKPSNMLPLFMSVVSEFLLSLALIIAWYVGYVVTLTLNADFLKTLPQPLSGFYALMYVFSFTFLYFAIAFYAITSSLKPALIGMVNSLLKSKLNSEMKLKISNDRELSIEWINKTGICVIGNNSYRIIPWTSMKDIEITPLHLEERKNKTLNRSVGKNSK